MSNNNKKWILYDIETTEKIGEGGKLEAMQISVLGWHTSWGKEVKCTTMDHLTNFVDDLKQAEMVVGFNQISFDNKVLQKYVPDVNLSEIPQFDIMREAKKNAGKKVALERFTLGTFDERKAGAGSSAPALWKSGNMDELIEYNMKDVDLTVKLFHHACKEGFLIYLDKQTDEPERINTSDWVMQGRRLMAGVDQIKEVMRNHGWTTVQVKKVESFLEDELKK